MADQDCNDDVPVEDDAASRGVEPEDVPQADEGDEKLKDALGVDDDGDDDEVVDTAADIEVEAATVEDQREGAEAALDAHGIDAEDLYAKEAVLPQNAQPSGGVLPPVEEQVGAPLTKDQLRQLAEQQAATEAVAVSTGWEQEDKSEPDEVGDAQVAEPSEPEPQVEPPPVEALAERDRYKDVSPENAGELSAKGEGGAKVRQVAGASEESQRTPLLQRPAEEQTGHPTHQNPAYQTGDTLPGDRSLTNDEPAYQVAVNHVPGTPLGEEYDKNSSPAPQPTSNPKRTPEELAELTGDSEDDC